MRSGVSEDRTATVYFHIISKQTNKQTEKQEESIHPCGKALTCAISLLRCERSQSAEKPSEYTQHGKAFALHAHSHAQRHERIHTEKITSEVIHCVEDFLPYTSLQVHKRTQTGQKPYKCNQCGKGFATPSHLKRHERIHTGEKPYKCNQCDKVFSQQRHLRTHEGTHTGEFLQFSSNI